MEQKRNFSDRWRDYRPTKTTLFWSCVGSVAVVLALGFTWGGWVTGSSAREVAEEAASTARAQLAAAVCVERFQQGPDVRAQLTALKEASVYQRDDLLDDGGWTTPVGLSEPVPDAAELCAERLIEASTAESGDSAA